ncbi:MAG: 50S ribosomal protein L17 [bacterium]
MIKNLGHKKLSKTGSHRRSMFANMAASMLLHEQLKTTVPRAKELRRVVEGVITSAKKGGYAEVMRILRNKAACKKVFDVIAPRYRERAGGFTRILRTGVRKGDLAETALVKLVL